jgi:hypothetical protein
VSVLKKGAHPFFSVFRLNKGYGPLLIVAAIAAGCGKKGPPLPPLLKLPAAPADVTAERRGDDVVVQLTVPAANTDASRPANVARVDVYAITAPGNVTDDEIVKRGTKIASVAVKTPRDPNDTADPDESEADVEAPVGNGLDQGARARVDEQLTADALRPAAARPADRKGVRAVPADAPGPLLGPSIGIAERTYAGVAVDKGGKRGPLSKRIAIPLVPPPPAPPTPAVTYTESAITVTWRAAADPTAAGVLPAHPLGVAAPALAYVVYDVPPGSSSPVISDAATPPRPGPGQEAQALTAPPPVETRLTPAPIAETTYTDARITWGAARCYAVRAVETIGALSVESGERPPACVTLTDTFPPAAPKGLSGVASEGAIKLIWEPNGEPDLAGYLVLRAVAPAEPTAPVTPAPVQATNFDDAVPAGVRYVYAVVAVDKAGNTSAPSNRFEETPR